VQSIEMIRYDTMSPIIDEEGGHLRSSRLPCVYLVLTMVTRRIASSERGKLKMPPTEHVSGAERADFPLRRSSPFCCIPLHAPGLF